MWSRFHGTLLPKLYRQPVLLLLTVLAGWRDQLAVPPWRNEETKKSKRQCRSAERMWRKEKLKAHCWILHDNPFSIFITDNKQSKVSFLYFQSFNHIIFLNDPQRHQQTLFADHFRRKLTSGPASKQSLALVDWLTDQVNQTTCL